MLRQELALKAFHKKQGYICDMDGVMYHGNSMLPGALEFVNWMQKNEKKFVFLTNSSDRSPRELKEKLDRIGISVSTSQFYTSALATASFLQQHIPFGSCFVIGDPGLISALYDAGFSMNDINPDVVVVGETRNYSYEKIELAVHLVRKGARLIGTNIDTRDKMHTSFVPGTGSLIRPIELTAGKQAYFIGKPNPIMIRGALHQLALSPDDAAIVGDRMDTDIIAGIESGLLTALVLSGVTTLNDLDTFSYFPDVIVNGVGDLIPPEFK